MLLNRTDEHFRVLMAGLGRISRVAHLPAILSCSGVKVEAAVDAKPDSARRALLDAGIDAPVFSTLPEAWERGASADGVVIATPNHTHAELAAQCLERGLHVLLEKPATTSEEQRVCLTKAAKKSAATLCVGYCYRYMKSVEMIEDLLRTRPFGEPRRFVMQYGLRRGWSPLSNYISDPAQAGGGALVVNGSHYLNRIITWFGYPETMDYWDDSATGLEANGIAEFSYPSKKLRGVVRVSKTVDMPAGSVVEFERARVAVRDWSDPTVSLTLKGSNETTWSAEGPDFQVATRPDMFRLQFEDFVRLCRTGDRPRNGLEEALATDRLITDLYKRRRPLREWEPQQCKKVDEPLSSSAPTLELLEACP